MLKFSSNFDDTDESLRAKSGSGMRFGLNQKVKLVKVDFDSRQSKSGDSSYKSLDLEFEFPGGSTKTHKTYPFNEKIYIENNLTNYSENPEAYAEAFDTNLKQLGAWLVHILKALGGNSKLFNTKVDKRIAELNVQDLNGENPAEISGVLLKTFADYANKLMEKPKELDIFYQYQWKLKPGNKIKFLELPKNMKQGYWICTHIPGEFEEVRDSEGLKFVTESGTEHMFVRSANYLASEFAKSGKVDDDDDDDSGSFGGFDDSSNDSEGDDGW